VSQQPCRELKGDIRKADVIAFAILAHGAVRRVEQVGLGLRIGERHVVMSA
jgi:hypothetical protein